MDLPPSGSYRFRFSGDVDTGAGGMYATSGGFGEPTVIETQIPELMERQAWDVHHIRRGEDDVVTIGSSEAPGEAFWHALDEKNGTPIILAEPTNFKIERAKNANNMHAYTIRLCDSDLYIGARGNQLVTQNAPVPVWEIQPAGSREETNTLMS